MSEDRKFLFSVSTPYPETPQVVLCIQTWEEHIVKRHPEAKLEEVRMVTENVEIVSPSNSEGRVVFTNPTVTSPNGTPLGVIVDTRVGEIVTAYYNRSLTTIDKDQVLWSRSDAQ
jgi:hypothetical protein